MDDRNRAVVTRYWPALDARDGEAMRALAHDDLVTEWSQSGERIRGKENCVINLQNYPGGWANATRAANARLRRRVWVTESLLHYPNGRSSHFVSIVELRDGNIARLTEYLADPFEPPAWRLELVDPM